MTHEKKKSINGSITLRKSQGKIIAVQAKLKCLTLPHNLPLLHCSLGKMEISLAKMEISAREGGVHGERRKQGNQRGSFLSPGFST